MGDGLGQDGICFQPVHSSPIHSLSPFAEWGPLMEGDILFSGGWFGTDWSWGLFERDLPAPVASNPPPPPPRLLQASGGERSATDRQPHSSPPTLN